ncbi:hypothetical protein [Roseisolibacter agri]|uniref:hypothetical protein n=1 Tax=Roseisolibacter agri TaxID=2014610 RepID=UPI0024E0B30C|nr:hypothetical protein [Roseisolibacter agri]
MIARHALAGLSGLAALVAPAGVLRAQTATAPGSAMVTLRLRPRAGDTLHLRFEQTVSGAAKASKPTRLLSSMMVISRSIVESSDAAGSVVVAHTDSVELRMPGAPPEALARARKGMQGRATRMRVAPDGAMRWLPEGGTGGRADAASGASTGTALGLPGALPAMPVAIGATWTRTMPLPWAEGTPARAEGEAPRLEVVFRLDSVGRGGTLAFVSMRGRLLAARGAPVRVGGAAVDGGTAAGQLRLDLGRGWIVDSRVDFALDLVPPSAASAAPGTPPAPPMRVVVSQRLVAR